MKNKQTGENEMKKKAARGGRRENKHLLSSGEMLFAPVWLFVFYRFDFITQFRSNISRSSGGSEEQGKVNVRKICFIIHWAPTAPSQPASQHSSRDNLSPRRRIETTPSDRVLIGD